METIEMIIDAATSFYQDLKKDENGRYRSWEHCYSCFYNARNKSDIDYDYLSLQLAFYLASWGMYRGSSFLLQKDYRVHIPVVKELLKSKYDILQGIECKRIADDDIQSKLKEIDAFLTEYYDSIRKKIKGDEIKNKLSATLITKILMGTFGCVPAYDRYFIAGIKDRNIASGTYNINSLKKLAEFYNEHFSKLESARSKMEVYGLPYPQMKLIDMGFWQIGFELDTSKGIKEAH